MLELAQLIVGYDIDYNEYDGTVFKVAENLKDPNTVAEMIAKYTDRLALHQAVSDDFQSFTPRTRSIAEDHIKKVSIILEKLRAIK